MTDEILASVLIVLGLLFPYFVYTVYRIVTAESKGDVDELPGNYDID